MNTLTMSKRIAPREILTATATLHGEPAYFSVTGELRDTRLRRDGGIVACGCLHAEILQHFPKLAPIVALHLSTADGVPMHAVVNGLYWLGLSSYPDARNLETFAKHWRCTAEEAASIDAYVTSDPNPSEALHALVRAEWAPRWKAEADAALALLAPDDTTSSASRQHYIDTGEYLTCPAYRTSMPTDCTCGR